MSFNLCLANQAKGDYLSPYNILLALVLTYICKCFVARDRGFDIKWRFQCGKNRGKH